ncbi:MAG: CDP-diacylglycerol--serine O-phosphatidyltransferase [bacterium]|nr:CDP-diacylglycerol--serine O-phosphatidyltransferase [bacterium]
MKTVSILPNALTLANAGCGILAISKAIDALALSGATAGAAGEQLFDRKLEEACWLIVLAMVFDALDGRVARMMDSFSDFGAQLDSFADAITFGVAPAILAKVVLEHEGVFHPRMNFLAVAAFALMAILRLARFNLETERDEESHSQFRGLPSPAAAGMVISAILMYLSIGGTIEVLGGSATPLGKGLQYLPQWLRSGLADLLVPGLAFLMPLLGLLMVSRVRYGHAASTLFKRHGGFQNLVALVFIALGLYIAPVPVLFFTGVTYVCHGIIADRIRARAEGDRADKSDRAA